MAPRPNCHPLHVSAADDPVRRAALAVHPAGHEHPVITPTADGDPTGQAESAPMASREAGEDGSMTTEYGLLAVVAATICSLVIKWASGGAVFSLLDDILSSVGKLLGMS